MVTITRSQGLTLPSAPAAAIIGGVLVALCVLAVPSLLLERLVAATGISGFLAAAEPPLGFTARIALGVVFGTGFAAAALLAFKLIDRERPIDMGRTGEMFRRSEIHPDAPPRPPLFANRELGTPFLEVKAPIEFDDEPETIIYVPAEQPLPADLDQPMASYDPGALLAQPLTPSEPLPPLSPSVSGSRPALIDPGDRFETFELTRPERTAPISLRAPAAAEPIAPPAPRREAVVAPETEATIHDLLARLERGIANRGPAPLPPIGNGEAILTEALGQLRRRSTDVR